VILSNLTMLELQRVSTISLKPAKLIEICLENDTILPRRKVNIFFRVVFQMNIDCQAWYESATISIGAKHLQIKLTVW
jgi:hypothetical protein